MLLSRLVPAASTLGALTLLSCSDPVPPPAEGGVYFRIFPGSSDSRPPNTACNVTTGLEAKVPGDTFPTAAGVGPWTSDRTGSPVVDGENNATVTCRVAGSGTFSASGRIRFKGVTFSLNRSNVPSSGNGSGSISTFDPISTANMSNGDVPCTITPLRIQAGAIWAKFRCPLFFDASAVPTTSCASEGVFLLQNCEQ